MKVLGSGIYRRFAADAVHLPIHQEGTLARNALPTSAAPRPAPGCGRPPARHWASAHRPTCPAGAAVPPGWRPHPSGSHGGTRPHGESRYGSKPAPRKVSCIPRHAWPSHSRCRVYCIRSRSPGQSALQPPRHIRHIQQKTQHPRKPFVNSSWQSTKPRASTAVPKPCLQSPGQAGALRKATPSRHSRNDGFRRQGGACKDKPG